MDRAELLAYLDRVLDPRRESDFGPNGLQVEGGRDVRKIVTGVSACQELFRIARQRDAQMILVHHGLFWDGMPRTITGLQYRRIRLLIEGAINLVAYHLPLDRHPELGNNVLAARALGLRALAPFAEFRGQPIGFRGTFPEKLTPDQLLERCLAVFGQKALLLGGGPASIETLGIVSGGAQRELYQAIDLGLDAYLTGEPAEWVSNVAREAGIHYFAAGHYATEVLGIHRLGEHLAETFGLEVEFVDVPNPV